MLKLAVAAALAAVPPSSAATSVEGLRRQGARIQAGVQGMGFAQAAEESERDLNLRLTRRAADKAYRAAAELAMIERTAAELGRELDALEKDPADQTRQDRVERLLDFTLDALPEQADKLSWVSGIVIRLKHEPPAPGDAEFVAAVREMDGRVAEADEAGKRAVAAVEGNHARIEGMAGLSERAKWLSARLAAYTPGYKEYSARVREESAKLAARVAPTA